MKFSLKNTTIVLIASIGLLIGIIAIFIYDKGIHDIIRQQYTSQSVDITRTVAVELDKDRVLRLQKAVREIYDKAENKVYSDQWGTPEFNEYIALFSEIEKSEDFLVLRDHLRRIQDVNQVNCLYLTWLDQKNECVVYLVDGAYEDACPPGCIDPIYGDFHEALEDPRVGFRPNITNTEEYGWIVATAEPILTDDGEYIAFSAVDISMNEIMRTEYRFLIVLAGILLVVTIIICIIGIGLVGKFIVMPINALSEAALRYTTDSDKHSFSNLHINRRDEIGALASSMVHMEEEIDGYVTNLVKTKNELVAAREHAEQMERAANIDALTKVRNKRAYDVDVLRLDEEKSPYGLAVVDMNDLKGINDTYGHEKGDMAITTLCAQVCRIFKYSPVYRIGGDEFVVILENTDYESRDILVEAFKEETKEISQDNSLSPWERVSAAIGYAIFDPARDKQASSVFKRADEAMYVNKREIKGASQDKSKTD